MTVPFKSLESGSNSFGRGRGTEKGDLSSRWSLLLTGGANAGCCLECLACLHQELEGQSEARWARAAEEGRGDLRLWAPWEAGVITTTSPHCLGTGCPGLKGGGAWHSCVTLDRFLKFSVPLGSGGSPGSRAPSAGSGGTQVGLDRAPSCTLARQSLAAISQRSAFSPAGCEPPGQSLPFRELSFPVGEIHVASLPQAC